MTFKPKTNSTNAKQDSTEKTTQGVLKPYSVFANTKGGTFYLGVEDKTYKLIGYELKEIEGEKLYFFSNDFKLF